jgi:nitrogen fixation-related uncharacterized protein
MNKQVLLIVMAIVTVCILYTGFFGVSKERFDGEEVKKLSLLRDPIQHQPELNNEIDMVPLLGSSNQMIPTSESDSIKNGDFDELNGGTDENVVMGFNCGKSCYNTQYPHPFDLPVDPLIADPLIADPLVVDPLIADPLIVDPLIVDPLVVDPLIVDPLVVDPLVVDPLVVDNMKEFIPSIVNDKIADIYV